MARRLNAYPTRGPTGHMVETALITGCSSGIGRATAERFRREGWEVYATARDPDELDRLADRGCRTARLDVEDADAVESVVDRVYEERGRLDCLVNNAGYGQMGPVEDVPVERVVRQFETNTFGPLRLVRAALPRMRERGRGTIVNVGAGFGSLTIPGLGAYTGSKYALHSLTDALRQEVSSKGVDVVLVEPGLVATEFYGRAESELDGLDRTSAYADLYRVVDDVHLVERRPPGVNEPEQVAEAIFGAATAARPKPVYRVGPLATVGTFLAGVLRGRARGVVTRAGLRALSSRPAQTILERLG